MIGRVRSHTRGRHTRALVVGSGPNGLAAAITLATAGIDVEVWEAADEPGGGARSGELTVPGLLHDLGSGFHPLGVASPFLRVLDLGRHGLRFAEPPIQLAHPLDDGRAALLWRDLWRTTDGLGVDGDRWSRSVGWVARRFEDLVDDVLRPVTRPPRHPLALARFGATAVAPATTVARRFHTEEAAALLLGVAAHGFGPLTRPLSASIGLLLAGAGHAVGWPVAVGGSRTITDALLARLDELGGRVHTGRLVTDLDDLPEADLLLLDTDPAAADRILGDRIPARIRRAHRRFRSAPAAWKLDLAVEGPVPWTNPEVGRAGTVHVGGSVDDMVRAEAAVNRGEMPERPFTIVGQQFVADPSRSRDGLNPLYVYAHVPNGYADAATTDLVLDHVERFAPGFRSRIRHVTVTGPADLEAMNPNLTGGDIAGGAADGAQLLFRPRLAPNPYSLGVPGVFLCSASTPPGAGVHGMSGHLAARSALRHHR